MTRPKLTFTTTFNQLKAANACSQGYKKLATHLGGLRKYGMNTPINLLVMLESNGIDDMLWSLRAVNHPDVERIARYIACDCAETSLAVYEKYAPNDNRPRFAVEAARKFVDGAITEEEMSAAESAARSAARSAAESAARSAAESAAWSAAESAAWSAQAEIIRQYLE